MYRRRSVWTEILRIRVLAISKLLYALDFGR